jgi:hypothetical protein
MPSWHPQTSGTEDQWFESGVNLYGSLFMESLASFEQEFWKFFEKQCYDYCLLTIIIF